MSPRRGGTRAARRIRPRRATAPTRSSSDPGSRCGESDGLARAAYDHQPSRPPRPSGRETPGHHRRDRCCPAPCDGGIPVAPPGNFRRGRRGARTAGDGELARPKHPGQGLPSARRGVIRSPRRRGSPGHRPAMPGRTRRHRRRRAMLASRPTAFARRWFPGIATDGAGLYLSGGRRPDRVAENLRRRIEGGDRRHRQPQQRAGRGSRRRI